MTMVMMVVMVVVMMKQKYTSLLIVSALDQAQLPE
jgi:hypothetical protein